MSNFTVNYITSDTVLTTKIDYILIDASDKDIICTLPPIGDDGDSYVLKRTDKSANQVTLITQDKYTIEDGTSMTMKINDVFRLLAYKNNYQLILCQKN